jgi:Rrf2 family cysteine metabolism transcriptional repressor
MKISAKGRYGLRALVDLFLNSKEEHVALFSIAQRQDISVQYLEHVFSALRRAGIVRSIKGPKGGYVLAIEAERLTVSTILSALEGNLTIMDSISRDEQDAENCIVKAVCNLIWQPLDERLMTILESVTLADLAGESIRLEEIEDPMFYI